MKTINSKTMISNICALLIMSGEMQYVKAKTTDGYKDLWIVVKEDGNQRKINYLEAITQGIIFPKRDMSKTLGGQKDDIQAIQDGIGVVILSLDFDKMNGDTAKSIEALTKLRIKYAESYLKNRQTDENIWNYINRTGSQENKSFLQKFCKH